MAFNPAPRRATYADVEALPPHLTGEIVDGELYVHPRPAPRHALGSSSLLGELSWPFHKGRGGPGGWWILQEPELHLVPEEPAVPDLAGWRRERMPAMPDTAYFALAPDWVCEVLSPSTEAFDRGKKMPLYARRGVRHAWLLDPVERYLEAFVNDAGVFRPIGTFRGEAEVRVAPFEAVAIELSSLWT